MKATQKRVRAKPGDILEVETRKGLHYLYYLGKHPVYGDAILVAPGSYSERPTEMNQLFEGGYVKFYPVGAAVYQGLVKVVEHMPMPDKVVPTRMRRAGVRLGTQIATWIIEDESGETVRKELSDEERQLPIASIWNHELLLQRLEEGWHPELETDGLKANSDEDNVDEEGRSESEANTNMNNDQVAL